MQRQLVLTRKFITSPRSHHDGTTMQESPWHTHVNTVVPWRVDCVCCDRHGSRGCRIFRLLWRACHLQGQGEAHQHITISVAMFLQLYYYLWYFYSSSPVCSFSPPIIHPSFFSFTRALSYFILVWSQHQWLYFTLFFFCHGECWNCHRMCPAVPNLLV